jgi:hypothetical protein
MLGTPFLRMVQKYNVDVKVLEHLKLTLRSDYIINVCSFMTVYGHVHARSGLVSKTFWDA